MNGPYVALCTGINVTAQQDIFEITAASTVAIIIHEFSVSQLSEVGDAAEEMLLILAKTGSSATTSGSGGSTTIPARPPGASAAASTVEINNTTKMTGGTITNRFAHNWNIRQPLEKVYTPETRPDLGPSQRFTLELATTPADACTLSASITFFEIGGTL